MKHWTYKRENYSVTLPVQYATDLGTLEAELYGQEPYEFLFEAVPINSRCVSPVEYDFESPGTVVISADFLIREDYE